LKEEIEVEYTSRAPETSLTVREGKTSVRLPLGGCWLGPGISCREHGTY
jgi:hypothetical protein